MNHELLQIVLQIFGFGALSVQLETVRREFTEYKKRKSIERANDLQRIIALEERHR